MTQYYSFIHKNIVEILKTHCHCQIFIYKELRLFDESVIAIPLLQTDMAIKMDINAFIPFFCT